MTMNATKNQKAAETRQRILDASLKLFLETGYEQATMRKIAQLSGLTPGATYYHFKTKEHIIFHFYEKSYQDHLEPARATLNNNKALKTRITGLIKTHLDVARPYHQISKALFRVASTPGHPLSPFSEETRELREENISLLREGVNGSSDRIPSGIKDKLPEILWLFKILIIIYWLFDTTPDQEKTDRLVDRSVDLIVRLLAISNLPGMKSFSERLVGLFEEFKPYQ